MFKPRYTRSPRFYTTTLTAPHLPAWQRIRDVLAGDAAIKRAGERYVARLDGQTDEEYAAYVARGYFYNATARTVSGYVGMIFRRDPVLLMPTEAEEREA